MTETGTWVRRSASNIKQPGKTFRPDLEGMRAVAVLAVLLDHLFGWPSGGFVGVDIFFVLSGFFITGLLLRERQETGTVSFRKFYVRRVRRIIPAALLVLAVTIVVGYIVFPAVRAKETFVDGLWSSIFLANWHFERVGTDYFQKGLPPSPLQHYWSLSIEEQFYFVWPVLLLIVFWTTRKAYRQGRTSVRHIALASTMTAICGLSFIWAVIQSTNAPTSAYFSTFTRVWELGVGAIVAITGPLLAKIPNGVIRPILSYTGLAGVVASLFLISSDTQFPGPGAALPVLSTALVVAAFHGSDVRASSPLTNPVAQYFGKVSYSLYLWHWPVIVLLAAVISESLTYYIVATVLAVGLSHVSYTYYENPIRMSLWLERDTNIKQRGVKFRITPQSWAMAAFLLVAALCASLISVQLSDRSAHIGEQSETLVVAGDSSASAVADVDPCFGAAAMANPSAGCPAIYEPDELVPSLDSFAKDNQGAYSCWRREGGPMQSCTYGSTEPDALNVALIGDSHAAMLLPALADQIVRLNWSLTTYLGNGCQWQVWSSGDRDCQSEMAKVQDRLLTGEKYDIAITTASREFGGSNKAAAAKAYVDAWEPVAARGTKIIAVADSPTAKEESIACITRFGADADTISRCGETRSDALAEEDSLIRATRQTASASLVDMTDLFCTEDHCPMTVGGVIVYRDTAGHISATFSRTLGPFLVERIRALR